MAPGFAGPCQIKIRIPQSARIGDAIPLEITGRNGTQNIISSAMIAIAE